MKKKRAAKKWKSDWIPSKLNTKWKIVKFTQEAVSQQSEVLQQPGRKSAGTAEFWRPDAVLSVNKLVATSDTFPKMAIIVCCVQGKGTREESISPQLAEVSGSTIITSRKWSGSPAASAEPGQLMVLRAAAWWTGCRMNEAWNVFVSTAEVDLQISAAQCSPSVWLQLYTTLGWRYRFSPSMRMGMVSFGRALSSLVSLQRNPFLYALGSFCDINQSVWNKNKWDKQGKRTYMLQERHLLNYFKY